MVREAPEGVTRAAREIGREEILARMGDPSLVIVDVLPDASYSEEHIPGAINLPLESIRELAAALLPDRGREIAVYCGSFT